MRESITKDWLRTSPPTPDPVPVSADIASTPPYSFLFPEYPGFFCAIGRHFQPSDPDIAQRLQTAYDEQRTMAEFAEQESWLRVRTNPQITCPECYRLPHADDCRTGMATDRGIDPEPYVTNRGWQP